MASQQIIDFAAKQNAFQDVIDTAIDGLTADIDALNAKILELQNTPPVLDAADQALLDEIQARGQAAADKIKALDDKTENPPVLPV